MSKNPKKPRNRISRTKAVNLHRSSRPNPISGYYGVAPSVDPSASWLTYVDYRGETHIIFHSDDKEECARLYDQVAKILFDEEAMLNFEEGE